ncbi:MAG: SH3 domain-containing protein, partial [Flavobacteriaceae bacterium]
LLVLLFVPLVSFGQMDYYVSAKGGLNVREAPEAKAKKVSTLSYGTFVSIESRTAIKLTINNTDKRTGVKKQIQGEWVKIISENNISGYVFDGYLIQFKPQPWTVFTTVSQASLNIKDINLKSDKIEITYNLLTEYYKTLKVGEIVQLVPLEKELPNLEFIVKSVEKVIYPDPDLGQDCCDEYKVEAIILETLPKKYIDFNKEYINSLIVHPPVKDAKFIDIPRIKAGRFGNTYRSWLDFDNDGNPDVRQEVDDKHDVIDILINGNWVELMIGVPM